jgi:multiple sugar transport system permease protein
MRSKSARLQLLVLLLPYIVGLVSLVLIPALLGFLLAFTEYNGLSAIRWVGLANFRAFSLDRVFIPSLRATLTLAVIAAPMRGLVALAVSSLLRSPYRGQGVLRYTAFLPTVIPEAAYALIWLFILNPFSGPLNWLLPTLWGPLRGVLPVRGRFAPTAWLLEPGSAQLAIAIMMFWTVGEGIVLLLAARRDIPIDLYEAAALDGASPETMFAHITLPLIMPLLMALFFRDLVFTIGASFTAAQIMTKGGPYYATTYLPYWAYLHTTNFGQLGYAAALNLLLFGITLATMSGLWLMLRRWWNLSDA